MSKAKIQVVAIAHLSQENQDFIARLTFPKSVRLCLEAAHLAVRNFQRTCYRSEPV